nr:hypothetical protein [Tanacetum cinerariifolium]
RVEHRLSAQNEDRHSARHFLRIPDFAVIQAKKARHQPGYKGSSGGGTSEARHRRPDGCCLHGQRRQRPDGWHRRGQHHQKPDDKNRCAKRWCGKNHLQRQQYRSIQRGDQKPAERMHSTPE